ncbi:rhodanese-like domain-containing protein [Candidatus Woesearchaeota archaeon]|nr:rhodanese-like domain-containing protein [Candidatus Woesearchaeota archaeon]
MNQKQLQCKWKIMLLLSVIFGALAGGIVAFIVVKLDTPTREERITDFYATENAVYVSPHSIRKAIQKGETNFILVDLRSHQEYEQEHIVGAINIPAYKDPDTSAYGEVERIVQAFSSLPKDKEIIVYCYSVPCMTGRKIGKLLAEQGIYVKHLGIGWNEWRYFWNLWNHEHEWNATRAEQYLARGKEPGTWKGEDFYNGCSIEGELGC